MSNNKLWTLKDIDEDKTYDKGNGIVSVERLKQEAIKEIKFLQTLPESLEDCHLIEKNNPELFEKYFALFDAGACYDNSNVIDYIKWKNNITEEDLK